MILDINEEPEVILDINEEPEVILDTTEEPEVIHEVGDVDTVEGDPCAGDSECPAGLYCASSVGECRDGSNGDRCDTTADCDEEDDICRGDPSRCRDRIEGDSCSGDTECPSGLYCASYIGECQDGSNGDYCDATDDCDEVGDFCVGEPSICEHLCGNGAIDVIEGEHEEVCDGDVSGACGPEFANCTAECTCLLTSCDTDGQCGSDNCTNGYCAPSGFVYIPAGTFCMGSPDGSTECMGETAPEDSNRYSWEEPQHEVTLTDSFFVQEHEVTQAQWLEVAEWWNAQSEEFRGSITMGTDPSYFNGTGGGTDCGDNCPVERVSWWDAVFFANAMSLREGLEVCYGCAAGWTGTPGGGCSVGATYCYPGDSCTSGFSLVGYECEGYRLSTEAEWEYAYRAGSRTVFYPSEGNDGSYSEENLTQIGWYWGNSGGTTHVVSSLNVVDPKESNAWGLYDMSGNVWEWVWDWWDSDYYLSSPAEDPLGGTGSNRVNRGGSWSSNARYARGANRSCYNPDNRNHNIGFRLVRSAP